MKYAHGQRVTVTFDGVVEAHDSELVVKVDGVEYKHYLPSKYLHRYQVRTREPLLSPGMVLRTRSNGHWFVRDAGVGNYIALSPVNNRCEDVEVRDFWRVFPDAQVVYNPEDYR